MASEADEVFHSPMRGGDDERSAASDSFGVASVGASPLGRVESSDGAVFFDCVEAPHDLGAPDEAHASPHAAAESPARAASERTASSLRRSASGGVVGDGGHADGPAEAYFTPTTTPGREEREARGGDGGEGSGARPAAAEAADALLAQAVARLELEARAETGEAERFHSPPSSPLQQRAQETGSGAEARTATHPPPTPDAAAAASALQELVNDTAGAAQQRDTRLRSCAGRTARFSALTLFAFAPLHTSDAPRAAESELLRFTLDALLPEEAAALRAQFGGGAEEDESAATVAEEPAAPDDSDAALMAEAEGDSDAEASYEEARLSYEEARFSQYQDAQADAPPDDGAKAATPPASPLRAGVAPPGSPLPPLSPLSGVAVAAVLDALLDDAAEEGPTAGTTADVAQPQHVQTMPVQPVQAKARFQSPPRAAARAVPICAVPPPSPMSPLTGVAVGTLLDELLAEAEETVVEGDAADVSAQPDAAEMMPVQAEPQQVVPPASPMAGAASDVLEELVAEAEAWLPTPAKAEKAEVQAETESMVMAAAEPAVAAWLEPPPPSPPPPPPPSPPPAAMQAPKQAPRVPSPTRPPPPPPPQPAAFRPPALQGPEAAAAAARDLVPAGVCDALESAQPGSALRDAAVALLCRDLRACAAATSASPDGTAALERLRLALRDDRTWAAASAAAEEERRRAASLMAGTVMAKRSAAESGAAGGRDAHGLYPHAWLVSGLAWPDDVDPARREQHMQAADFQRLMGMDVEGFNKLPAWKQVNLRKKHDLF